MRHQLAARIFLVVIGIAGLALSVYAGWIEARQYRALEQLRIAETIDGHFVAANEHILARVSVARTVARFFVPPPLSQPRPLADFGARALALAPDLATIGWLPEVEASRAEEALETLRRSGISDPKLRGADGRPIDPAKLARPLYPILDIAPTRNRFVLGVDAGTFPHRLQAIRNARQSRELTRTPPVRLVQAPDEVALLLYAPIFADNGEFRGVMGFGFKVNEFFRAALTSAKIPANAAISVFSHEATEPLFSLPRGNDATTARRATTFERKMEFARSELRFVYAVPRDLAREGLMRGLSVAGIGLLLTLATVAILAYMANSASVLAREVSSRRSAEERLKVLIHELNHRVRNVMSVAQAVVRLSFTPGLSISEIQKTCEGRLQALSQAMSLLTESDWKSLNLRSLVSEEVIPFAHRIKSEGPDIALRARAAQTFALLFHELATNAATHGALSVPSGEVSLRWRIDNLAGDPVFHLHWKESGGPQVSAPARKGFGELLIRRIAPRDVAGKSEVHYDAAGYEYKLQAPLSELIGPAPGKNAAA
jgi:two-component sensor histidine kinase